MNRSIIDKSEKKKGFGGGRAPPQPTSLQKIAILVTRNGLVLHGADRAAEANDRPADAYDAGADPGDNGRTATERSMQGRASLDPEQRTTRWMAEDEEEGRKSV
jgi:hypothetical protein